MNERNKKKEEREEEKEGEHRRREKLTDECTVDMGLALFKKYLIVVF